MGQIKTESKELLPSLLSGLESPTVTSIFTQFCEFRKSVQGLTVYVLTFVTIVGNSKMTTPHQELGRNVVSVDAIDFFTCRSPRSGVANSL